MRILFYLENLIYRFRDLLWDIPQSLFFDRNSFLEQLAALYRLTIPYSHFVLATVLVFPLLFGLQPVLAGNILNNDTQNLIEAVVVGLDGNGNLQSLSKINPLLTSAIQLEKDLSEIIYEPLIRYLPGSEIEPVLAKEINRLQEGAEYEFILRDDVYWHDGTKFGVQDVIKTLEIIAALDDQNPVFSNNTFVKAVKQMAWERTGQNAITLCTTTAELQATLTPELINRKCTGVEGEKPIIANFLEIIAFKIMPAHLIGDLNTLTIQTPQPLINRLPVGTGAYKFDTATSQSIILQRNDKYYRELPFVRRIEFRLFADIDSAVQALKNAQVHTLSTVSTQFLPTIDDFHQININRSPVLQNQYWGIYFNLRKNPQGEPIGPASIQDVRVRQAISAAINRELVIATLLNVGEEALGPIYSKSEFFNPNTTWYRYNFAQAEKLLDESGWKIDPALGMRTKDNKLLSLKLAYADSFDRRKVVESIRLDLQKIGVEIIPEAMPLDKLSKEVVTTKLFDLLFFGMSTYSDPDRYELFHSSQSSNLNLSSYAGTDLTSKIEGNATVRVPRVDRLLEIARSVNPLTNKQSRIDDYRRVQDLIAMDTPVIFLYHPQFLYFSNRHLQGMDLSHATSLETRFSDIAKWRFVD